MPELDGASYEETKALGLADTTVEAIDQAMAQVISGEGTTPETNPDGTVALQDSNLTGSADDMLPLEDASSLEMSDEGEGFEMPGMEVADDDELYLPVVDASLVADTTNVIAAALAQIMDPAT